MTKIEIIQKYGTRITEAMTKLANATSDLPEELIAPTLDLYNTVAGASEAVKKTLKDRVKTMVTTKGRVFTEAGSKVFDLAGWRMEIRPSGGGLDMSALSILLNQKGIKKSEYCDLEKVWHPNKDMINQLIGAGRIKQKDLDSCMKEPGYSVQSPSKIEVKDE